MHALVVSECDDVVWFEGWIDGWIDACTKDGMYGVRARQPQSHLFIIPGHVLAKVVAGVLTFIRSKRADSVVLLDRLRVAEGLVDSMLAQFLCVCRAGSCPLSCGRRLNQPPAPQGCIYHRDSPANATTDAAAASTAPAPAPAAAPELDHACCCLAGWLVSCG
jgi:hypothetical protein